MYEYELYLEEIKKKRNIKPKQYKDYETRNIVEKYQTTMIDHLKFQKAETLNNTRTHFLSEQWSSGTLWTMRQYMLGL